MAILHLLSFPGVFAPDGLVGGTQSTAYLFIFWHTGFPLTVAAYALLKEGRSVIAMPLAAAIGLALLVTAAAVAALGTLAIVGSEPILPRGNDARSAPRNQGDCLMRPWVVLEV